MKLLKATKREHVSRDTLSFDRIGPYTMGKGCLLFHFLSGDAVRLVTTADEDLTVNKYFGRFGIAILYNANKNAFFFSIYLEK